MNMTELDQIKKGLRKELKQKRNALTADYRDQASQEIVDRIMDHEAYRKAKLIFSFYPMATEIQVDRLFDQAEAAGKQLCFPVTFKQGRMEAYIPRDRVHMDLDPYGFPTPNPQLDQLVDPAAIDLALVPLLGFDPDLYRIGYGGGFYDRYIARMPDQVVRMGVAYAVQELDYIPRNAYDQKLDLVITERAIFTAQSD
ncbi:MAG: 5-formyltetrahydrofolate cyclo-ligase [Eubacteriales bacterium]|nr:5-formyltetrahydrofolate cyclo-ligase [Eubacteriales bacterium]